MHRLTSTNINSSSRFISSPDSGSPASHAARRPPPPPPACLGASSPNATPGRAQVDGAVRATSGWRYETVPLCPQTQSAVQRQKGLPRFARHVTSGLVVPAACQNDWASFLHHMSEKKQNNKNRIFFFPPTTTKQICISSSHTEKHNFHSDECFRGKSLFVRGDLS